LFKARFPTVTAVNRPINSLKTDSSRGLAGAYSGFELRGREKKWPKATRFEVRRAESGDGVLEKGARGQPAPSPPARGSGERCN